MVLQGCYPNQKAELESTSHAQTTTAEVTCKVVTLFSLYVFMHIYICSGMGAENNSQADFPLPLTIA